MSGATGKGDYVRLDLELVLWLAGTLLLAGPALVVLRRRGHSWPYLLSLLILTVYLSLVARETQVYHAAPDDPSSAYGFSSYVNLMPGSAGPNHWSSFDLTQVIINILLGVPLGFGLNFLRVVRLRSLPWPAIGLGLTIEVLQLVVSLVAGHPRHIADVNDLLLNAFGVVVGYTLFRGLARLCSVVRARGDRVRGTANHSRPPGLRAYLVAVTSRDADGSLR